MKNNSNLLIFFLFSLSCFFSTSVSSSEYYSCSHNSTSSIPSADGFPDPDSAGSAMCAGDVAINPDYAFEGTVGTEYPDAYHVKCGSTFTYNYGVSCGTSSCPDPQVFDFDTGQCETPPAPVDCSGNTETRMASWFSAASGEVSYNGCNYTTGPNVCGYDGFCTGTITGTGANSSPETIEASEVSATPTEIYEQKETTDSTTSTQNTSQPTQTLGDGTTVESSTTTESNTSPTNTTLTYDGTTVIQSNKDGSTTNTTTITETITNPDGSLSITETTNITHNTGSTTVTTTNVNTGEVTTSTTSGTTYGGTSTNTSNYDSSGSLTSQSGTSDSGTEEAEEAMDKNNFEKTAPTDAKEVSESATDFFDRLNSSPIANAVNNINVPVGGTCPTGSVGGYLGSLTLDYHCIVIENNKAVLSIVMIAVWGLLGIKIVMSA